MIGYKVGNNPIHPPEPTTKTNNQVGKVIIYSEGSFSYNTPPTPTLL